MHEEVAALAVRGTLSEADRDGNLSIAGQRNGTAHLLDEKAGSLYRSLRQQKDEFVAAIAREHAGIASKNGRGYRDER